MINLPSLRINVKIITLGLSAILFLANSSAFAQDAACNQEVSNHLDKFKDVAKTHYAAEAVEKLAAQDIVKGSGEGFLGATCDTTREHAAIFLYRLKYESKPDTSKTVPFTDILSLSDESKNAIQTLYSKGVVNGTSSDKFSPNDPLTRAAAATMIARAYFTDPDIEKHSSMAPLFDDVASDKWYFNTIQTLAYECIVAGTGDKKFNPDTNMSRIDFIFVLAHAHEIIARCKDGKTCNVQKGICAECDPTKSEKKCDGKNLQKCSDDGQYVKEKECPNGCTDGACSGEETPETCKEGEKSCDGNFAVTCSGGKLQKTDCTTTNAKCVDGACKKIDEGESGKCTDGKTQCNAEGNHQICENGKWKADPCPNKQICKDGKCVKKDDDNEKCTDDKLRCNEDDNVRQKCVSGKWEDDPCKKTETCSGAGKCVADASCTTGDSKCEKGVHMTCKKGKWTEDACKSGYVCKENKCVEEEIVYEDEPSCSQGNSTRLPIPLTILMMLTGAGLLIRRRRHSA